MTASHPYLRANDRTMLIECCLVALQVVNHAGKRTMLNTVTWVEKLEELEPGFEMIQLERIIEQIKLENQQGIKMCMKFAHREELQAGLYTFTPAAINLAELITQSAKRLNVSIVVVPEEFPRLLMGDEGLIELVFDNVIHNAQQHGLQDGEIQVMLRVGSKTVVLVVTSKPGPNHDRNLALQAERGENNMIRDCASNVQYRKQIGCNDSTFRGLSEIERAAKAMGARANLAFQQESVEFSLTMQMVLPEHETAPTELPANAPTPTALPANGSQSSELSTNELEPTEFPEGTVIVGADDDKVSRMMLNALICLPGLNADQTKSIVVGETLQEAQGLVQTVMDMAARVGERKVICIFDQMMGYGTNMVLGTEITADLRSLGFKGIVLIRSANDDHFAREMYRDAGASGFLSKTARRGPEIVKSIVSQWHNAS